MVLNKPAVKQFIIDANHGQLFSGIDSEGNELGEYAESTKKRKQRKGQPFDRVTLKDSGAYYDSFKIVVTASQILIVTDHVKSDGTDLHEEWGEDIEGLTVENTTALIEFLKTQIQLELLMRIGA